ncbi:DUF4280 domain-containing protein [Phytoactinopolyspora alkaliphila]|uniref:DUF4280 domain-containing protein n=1 Tax=Phytoactinopolyspora alkaliphila TaxID=1783498 RepID=A0A6N9YFK8_9ACTN|nr:DUF4280 domain-containing protein [Phytoactinopolyspora alkaliphila]NED93720.1 DUF4280 domain-containing protein [Phytoactinopolyspora alkaliphila]
MAIPLVVDSATLLCSFGTAPSALGVLPVRRTLAGGRPVACLTDAVPVLNIRPFGMCTSLANPAVASATAAALGVLTPQPCVPATSAWAPGAPATLIGGTPAVTVSSTCACAYGGMVTVLQPGNGTVLGA